MSDEIRRDPRVRESDAIRNARTARSQGSGRTEARTDVRRSSDQSSQRRTQPQRSAGAAGAEAGNAGGTGRSGDSGQKRRKKENDREEQILKRRRRSVIIVMVETVLCLILCIATYGVKIMSSYGYEALDPSVYVESTTVKKSRQSLLQIKIVFMN